MSQPLTILVVDDEPTIAHSVQVCLEAKGLAVQIALTAAEAREALAHELPHLVLLDVKLKEADGLALLRWIRSAHPSLPVLVLTGYDTEELTQQLRQLGVIGTIHKPVTLPELQEAVLAIVAKLKS